MKVCDYCGIKVENDVQKCDDCGSRAFSNICEGCGETFAEQVCPKCGLKAGEKPVDHSSQNFHFDSNNFHASIGIENAANILDSDELDSDEQDPDELLPVRKQNKQTHINNLFSHVDNSSTHINNSSTYIDNSVETVTNTFSTNGRSNVPINLNGYNNDPITAENANARIREMINSANQTNSIPLKYDQKKSQAVPVVIFLAIVVLACLFINSYFKDNDNQTTQTNQVVVQEDATDSGK